MQSPTPTPSVLSLLYRYNLPYWDRYAWGTLFALVVSVLELSSPAIVRFVVRGFEQDFMTGRLLLLALGGLLVLSMIEGGFRYGQRLLMIRASRQVEYDLRNDFFAQLQRLSAGFYRRNRTGDLMARATNDVNYVRELIGPGILGTADMFRLPLTIGYMLFISTELTLIMLIPLPFISIIVFVLLGQLNKASKRVQEIYGDVTTAAQENLAGARVVKAYGIAARENTRFEAVGRKYMQANLRYAFLISTAFPMLSIVVGVIIILLVWQGGRLVIEGDLLLADLLAFMFALVLLAWPLAQLAWVLTLYQRGAAAMKRLGAIFAEVPEIADDESVDADARIASGRIEFDRVGVSYDEHPVLADVSFTVEPGQCVAIVGATGSGKTTLAAALIREFDPNTGAIRIDGRPLGGYPLAEVKQAFGYVPQDVFLFSDTIRANLMLANPDASPEALRHACDMAQFGEVLDSLPDGLDTVLGERGVNLSGGQKQRLTLARAILRNPRILILDDSLSSVDTHTESRILEGLIPFVRERTAIIIAHRISTIQHADRILVLDGGRIAEAGSHEELVAADGRYAEMHRRQMLEAALEEA